MGGSVGVALGHMPLGDGRDLRSERSDGVRSEISRLIKALKKEKCEIDRDLRSDESRTRDEIGRLQRVKLSLMMPGGEGRLTTSGRSDESTIHVHETGWRKARLRFTSTRLQKADLMAIFDSRQLVMGSGGWALVIEEGDWVGSGSGRCAALEFNGIKTRVLAAMPPQHYEKGVTVWTCVLLPLNFGALSRSKAVPRHCYVIALWK
ncbi:unnamed protein product [Citrullus colocynthis]|uniref:Uncharacterized protein n=1 Tax=Citrullus colocynthis TaxID=252529 RepID=A0ABP0YG80_9ROSI